MNEPPVPFRSHTALLLSTALPFLQPAFRHPVELAMKFLEFSETLKLFQEFHMKRQASLEETMPKPESGMFGFLNSFILDIEGLLQSLSSVCTGDEKEIIGMFLNLIRAKRFYETYGDLLNSLMQGGGLDSMFGSGGGSDLLSSLSLLNPDLFSAQQTDSKGSAQAEDTKAENTEAEHGRSEASEVWNPHAEPSFSRQGSTENSDSSLSSSYINSLTSLLNEEQKETLELLKTLFASDAETPDAREDPFPDGAEV